MADFVYSHFTLLMQAGVASFAGAVLTGAMLVYHRIKTGTWGIKD
jgi:hypothetical protein